MNFLKRRPAEVLVSIAALVVSVAAVYVSVQANRISSRQAEIAERRIQPVINATSQYAFVGSRAAIETITVTNDGAPANAFEIDVRTALRVTYQRRTETPVQRTLPLLHYFGGIGVTGQSKGVLATISGGRNNERMAQLHRQSGQYGRQRGDILLLDLYRYLRVSYADQLGTRHTDYLRVSPVGGSAAVPRADGEAVFANEDRALRDHAFIELDEATPQTIIKTLRRTPK